ncbi:hypothetical protein CDD83_6873 [Cordyceps sp. RAO-2017]|nr:hypothetical protein CDD83_6873 [Cordyceps sp. RAO-2017]
MLFQCRGFASAAAEPLRILFCGSQRFSIPSLEALYRERGRDPGLVRALEVLVTPPRRSGRGLKVVEESPCQRLAERLGLRIHQRETFTGWELPQGTNLIIVVSFRLFVPPRILRSAKYGGLNVHPSFLPDLRGPAPLHRALLRGDDHIGMSLQTLDEDQIDHGTILAQTPKPGFPIPPGAGIEEVTQEAATRGAQMLIEGLRGGLYLPPRRDVGWKAAELEGQQLVRAPKVTRAESQIDWTGWTRADEFERRIRACTKIWTQAVDRRGQQKRVIFTEASRVAAEEVRGEEASVVFVHEQADGHGSAPERRRQERRVMVDRDRGSCAVLVGDATWVLMTTAQVEGKTRQDAATALAPFLRTEGGAAQNKQRKTNKQEPTG